MTRLAFLLPLAVACSGGAKPTTIENKATGPLLPIQSGFYPCEFLYGDYPTGPYRCTVQGDRIKKERGLEFIGTLVPHGDAIRIDAEISCGANTYYPDMCKSKFSIDLVRQPNGSYRGKVVNPGKLADIGLADQTFQITNAGMGGDQYGGAGYGGHGYGG